MADIDIYQQFQFQKKKMQPQSNCLYVCLDTEESNTNSIAPNSIVLVAKVDSFLVRQLIATPNPSKQDICRNAYCAEHNIRQDDLPQGVVFHWDHHPAVESYQLNAFDYGFSGEVKTNGTCYVSGGGYFNYMKAGSTTDEVSGGDLHRVGNCIKDGFGRGGTIALFLMAAKTRKAKEDRQRLYLTEMLKLHHNTI